MLMNFVIYMCELRMNCNNVPLPNLYFRVAIPCGPLEWFKFVDVLCTFIHANLSI